MTPITSTAELAAFCDKLKGQAFVAVDTEFMRETTYWPKLCLVQAAAPNAEAVIDPLAEGIDLEPFLEVLRDESILKVFLAARPDGVLRPWEPPSSAPGGCAARDRAASPSSRSDSPP